MSLRSIHRGPVDDDDFPDERDDVAQKKELGAMLMGSGPPTSLPEVGTIVKGPIIQIGDLDIFIDIGAKAEATIDKKELLDPDGNLEVALGDELEASVVSVKDGIRLSRGSLKAARSRQAIDEAFAAGLPVEGKVEGVNKGGLEVLLGGGMRAFCPMSQIDERRVEDPQLWVGRTLEFLVVDMGRGRGKNAVVSRRKLLEAKTAVDAEVTRAKLVPGAVVRGKVSSLQNYGAFIELGGLQGLLHISDISHTRLSHPGAELTVGDEVAVKVLRVDAETGKISLGRKQLLDDPWATVSQSVPVGGEIAGHISRVAEFGAFVEVAPGIEGLVHVSELAAGKKVSDARKIAKSGDRIRVRVQEVDAAKRRISLARVDDGPARAEGTIAVGSIVDGVVARVEPFGVFVRLGPGQTGLVPNEELGSESKMDHAKEFPPDTPMKVEILAIEDGGKKIRLSRARAMQRAEREEVDKYRGDSGAGFSTLGDIFKKQLGRS